MIDIDKLQTFVAVCEELNLTRAAERRHLTPPSASAQIRSIEDALQLALFTRTSRGMALTPAGATLREAAQRVLDASGDLLDKAALLRQRPSGLIRIGLNGPPDFLRLGPLTACLREKTPEVELESAPSSSGLIVQDLRRESSEMRPRRFDAGFVNGFTPEPGFQELPLGAISLVVAGPASWKDALGASGWENLSSCDWLHSQEWCPFEEVATAELSRRGLPYRRGVRAGDDQSKSVLAEAGLGLAVMEETEARERERAGKLAVWTPSTLTLPLSFVWRTTDAQSPALNAVVECVRSVWADDAATPAAV